MRHLWLLLTAACASAPAILPPPPRTTEARLVEGGCDAAEGPASGQRVFARLTVEHGEIWLLVDGQRVYTSGDRCVAFDLADGDHQVIARAAAEGGTGGVGVGVELASGKATTRAFAFQCGAPGSCDRESLQQWSRRSADPDPCATARARGIRWQAENTSDGIHPQDLQIAFTLRTGAGTAEGCVKP